MKPKLTNGKKLQILKDMLELISGTGWSTENGLCDAFRMVDHDAWMSAPWWKEIVALGIEIPERLADSKGPSYWWPLNKDGLAARKRAVRSAIKRLEK